MTIGERAYECVKARAEETGTTQRYQIELLGVSWQTKKAWREGICDPRAIILAEMCRRGYDVIYILTGEKK
jgi:hypothetical protein